MDDTFLNEYLSWNGNTIVVAAVRGSIPAACAKVCKNFISATLGTPDSGLLYSAVKPDGNGRIIIYPRSRVG